VKQFSSIISRTSTHSFKPIWVAMALQDLNTVALGSFVFN
jgi:hypothetical protein